MKFSYNWLKELVPKLPKSEKLADALTMHAFEVESLEKRGNDIVFDIAVLPNRIADASGHIGLARDIAAILKTRVVVPRRVCKELKKPAARDMVSVEIQGKNLCQRYIARVMRGVSVTESPQWLKDRLEVCGIRPINAIVDATNYVMLETGQPLHAFDYAKLAGGNKKKISVRLARKGEKMTTLDDAVYELTDSTLVIADEAGALAVAGIKGGKRAGIEKDTDTIVVEAARFDGPTVRKASQAFGLRTDASTRFSVGLDPALAAEAMERVCTLIEKVAGGEALKGSVDIYPKKDTPRRVALRLAYVRSLLGADIKDSDITAILKRLGCSVKHVKGVLTVTPPTVRRDLAIEEDLVEEVGRIYGYEHIVPAHPLGELVPPEVDSTLFWRERARDALQGIGFEEVYNYSFVGGDNIVALGGKLEEYLELENPARPEFQYLRRSLLPGFFKNARENLKHEDAVHMFEVGAVFALSDAKGTHREEKRIGGFIATKSEREKGKTFFELKGALTTLFERMSLSAWFDDQPPITSAAFHPYRAARIKVGEAKDGRELGILGEMHPALLSKLGIKGTMACFQLDLARLAELAQKEKEFRPISRYPSVMRDIALLVPLDTRMVEVEDIIENTGGELLQDTDLFDIYEGSELPEGKKSFAFRLVFQSHERTLTDVEVDAVLSHIKKSLEAKDPEWEVR